MEGKSGLVDLERWVERIRQWPKLVGGRVAELVEGTSGMVRGEGEWKRMFSVVGGARKNKGRGGEWCGRDEGREEEGGGEASFVAVFCKGSR